MTTCAALILTLGCSRLSTSPVCTQEFRPGLAVSVKDSLSGAGIASGASLIARDGAFKDSVAFPEARPDLDNFAITAAGERAGTYGVTVIRTGYLPWTKNNVQVTADVCHVNTVSLTARMKTN